MIQFLLRPVWPKRNSIHPYLLNLETHPTLIRRIFFFTKIFSIRSRTSLQSLPMFFRVEKQCDNQIHSAKQTKVIYLPSETNKQNKLKGIRTQNNRYTSHNAVRCRRCFRRVNQCKMYCIIRESLLPDLSYPATYDTVENSPYVELEAFDRKVYRLNLYFGIKSKFVYSRIYQISGLSISNCFLFAYRLFPTISYFPKRSKLRDTLLSLE